MTGCFQLQSDGRRSPFQTISMRRRSMVTFKSLSYLLALSLVSSTVWCQTNGSQSPSDTTEKAVMYGGYQVHQSVEAGYRVSDETGSGRMFDTMVNLHDGPRVFEQSLSMHSPSNQGTLFDSLSVNSVGWGGDPNNFLRMRVGKAQWYDFRASFRRDQNFFDFDLLANPLNPTGSNPNVPLDTSPHGFETRRRMSDLDLSLLPESKVSFRLGFSRNNMTGSSWTSMHEGTDALLFQPWNTTLNSYRMGADFKLLPRTVISYDQFLNYFKGDTSQQLDGTPYALANGKAVDLGLPFNTGASQPCATPLLTGGVVNPACNGYFAYSRFQATRNSTPTEQVSFRSNYFRRLDLTGSFGYTGGEVNLPVYSELFDGLLSRTRGRNSFEGASGRMNRISATADAGVVLHVTDRFRLVDNFRFYNFRLPGARDYVTAILYGATLASTPNVFSPATCPPPFTAATCPQHSSSSGADLTIGETANFLKQDTKRNTFEAQYDFTRKISGHLGYRYQRRTIFDRGNDFQTLSFYPSLPNRGACAGLPLDANGVCTTTATTTSQDTVEIEGHSLLAGTSLRPARGLRLNFDTEQFFADTAFTRVSPRKEARYRVLSTYAPQPWAVVGVAINLLSDSNGNSLTNYDGHNRSYGFNASLNPKQRFGLDVAYDYTDFAQNSLICFNDTPPTGVILPVVTNAGSCAANEAANPLLTTGAYQSNTHFGMAAVMVRPIPRVTTRLGYSITRVGGSTPQFNILQPLGSLDSSYQQPLAGLEIALVRNLTWHAAWNYYQYNENDFAGPTRPRYFHANDVHLALRYAF
jgi:hypothetical protein